MPLSGVDKPVRVGGPEREIEKSIVVLHAEPSDDWSTIYLFLNSISEEMVRQFPFLNAAAYLYSIWTTTPAQSRYMPDRIHYSQTNVIKLQL